MLSAVVLYGISQARNIVAKFLHFRGIVYFEFVIGTVEVIDPVCCNKMGDKSSFTIQCFLKVGKADLIFIEFQVVVFRVLVFQLLNKVVVLTVQCQQLRPQYIFLVVSAIFSQFSFIKCNVIFEVVFFF